MGVESPMFICICNAIRETDLRCAARRCPGDADAVYDHLGYQPQCGQCLDDAAAILIDERAKEMVPAAAS